jgi:uncharacterized alpha-E superfamily protein
LRNTVDHLFRLAIQVRDRTSNDMWRVISRLNDRFGGCDASVAKGEGDASSPVWKRNADNAISFSRDEGVAATSCDGASHPRLVMLAGDAVGVLNETLQGLAAFHGLARENMTRAQAWRFIDMGLRIERAIYLGTLLDCALRSDEPENPSVLETILEVADSSITYRSRYSLLPQLAAVYDLILLDDKNPRSVLFQINQLVQHFERLPQERDVAKPGSGRAILHDCAARLERGDTRELAGLKANWHESKAGRLNQQTLRDLPKLSDAIAASYFAHSAISRTGRGD